MSSQYLKSASKQLIPLFEQIDKQSILKIIENFEFEYVTKGSTVIQLGSIF